MATPNNLQIEPDLRQSITDELHDAPALIPERDVAFGIATEEYAASMAALYKSAFERGDYFASRYDNPEEQIFNRDWLVQDLEEPSHIRFIFTDHEQQLLGTTALFYDNDSEAGPLITSDATQIDHIGRGKRIMDHFFKRLVPIIEASGAGIATDFVLTPESKGLRRSLQTDLGMIAVGIHPHALRHQQLGITRSEISAAKYKTFTPKPVRLLAEFEPLYRIVRSQLPTLLKPNVVTNDLATRPPQFVKEQEIARTVDANDLQAQLEAVDNGWQPVEFDPDNNLFKVAQFPGERPNLDFILTNEDVPANRQLVRYLNDVLYGFNKSDN